MVVIDCLYRGRCTSLLPLPSTADTGLFRHESPTLSTSDPLILHSLRTIGSYIFGRDGTQCLITEETDKVSNIELAPSVRVPLHDDLF